ncbi:zonadhesin-like isoform X2 [Epinephelus moara]|uniref:zonadhesin-like isoform X2 n=1 Tax=Epinephelus moara TaxID=300413 RepID=UPI00214E72FB|nr:zonadhesin-like isoform X2 [Epinephelus moara]
MLGGIRTDLLVTVTLLLLTQTGTQCRAEVDFSLVTLPDWSPNADYVSQCFYDRQNNFICDWTQWKSEDFVATILESGPLGLEGEACLEFWYISPVVTDGSELRVLLRSSAGLKEIWTLTALPRDSWRQVFVPLNVIEPGTQVVVEAVSTSGQFAFNLMGVRRGQCGPQCESNTELWTDESTRCLCSSGQLSCSPSQCPEGQICGPQTGSSRGISTSGTCTIHSHTDCSTFDGVLFRFMAPCTYTLAKTCSPSEALPMFSVEVVNEQNWNSSLPTVQQVVVNVGKFRVSLLRRQTHRVVVNGVWRKLPLSLSSGTINIKSNPAAVELETSFGLSVSFDNAGAVHVKLPSTYSDKVCGLCGNFNHLRRDDFRKPDGTNAQDATALAKSWQTEENTSSCETILVPHQCDPQEEAEYASELYCGGLLSSTGPFAGCLAVLGAESYFRGCVVDMCTAHGDPAALCETLQVYADICQEAGVAVPVWRNSTFCPLQCGENSHYNSCADGCPDVCSVLDIVGSCGGCDERCECDSGFKLSGGKCVPAEDCGCWYSGKHYEKGATFSEGECVQQCQCMGNNEVQCTRMQCANHEVCKVKDGVKGCFPFKPATCSVYGDPHYITFDGMAYDFQGGCSYTLTTTCGGQSSVQFTVIGHNMHPPIQNFTRSKLEAVTLKVEDLYLTLNQSGEVYVKNRPVLLPYFTNGTYGSVWVDLKKNYIVMETTFGLRITIDTQNRLFLQVDERYKYELCGLCGTYSDRQDDDFVAPEGQNATGPFEFGDSWRVPGDDECVSHPNDPRLCDYDQENEAYNECYTILGDAFKPCHESIHPSIYLNSCVYDYCATNGDRHTLCESLKSYAAACSVAGVELPHWQMDTACVCPINCDFERNLCGWEQLVQDSFDWTRHSGPTPTSLTGPNQDHTTGAGYYMYIEGNSVTHGDSARLWSSNCHYNGPLCLNFWYHMYGSATAMALNIYLLKDKKATKLWSMRNNQGPEWHLGNADIRVSGPFQIIVEGIRGSTDQSDVAIDDISIHFGACSGTFPGLGGGTELPPITTEVLPSHSVCNMDCSFDSNLCSWDQMITDAFDWTWQSGSTPTLMTGPSADHTGDGHYLYIEASSVTYGDMSRLISPECSDSGPQCLQFWYHMYGSADTMGLHVYLLQNRSAHAVWRKRNDQGNMWHLAQVDITTTGAFQIIFEGRRGSNEESDVAIDDVKLYRGRCSNLSGVATNPPSVPVPTTAAPQPPLVNVTAQLPDTAPVNGPLPRSVCNMDCSFDSNLCSWDQMITDAFDWTWQSGSTPTLMTGPSADHTGDGHYLYIEASSVTYGDMSRLISPECSDSGPQCLQFWYHMYGSADTMGLHVYLLQNRSAHAVWRKRNDQGNMWHLAQVDITTTGAFQIIFEGRRGSNEESDVAIDDVKLYRGRCSNLSGVATNPPSVPVPTTAAPQPPLVNVTAQLPDTAPVNGPLPRSVCNMDCSFDSNLCSWDQMITDAFDWTWQSGSTPTLMTGPSADHTGDGHYLYIEASSVTYGDTSRLISPECSDSGPQCLQFWYHMYGSADTMGLHVYLLQNRFAHAVWRKRNDQGNMWHLAQVDITTTGAFQIIFEGRRGSNEESDVAIDDVKLYRGRCSDLSGGVATNPPSDPVPTTAAPQPPLVNVTALPPVANVTIPPAVEATTNVINDSNVTVAPADGKPPHPVCQLDCNFEQDLCQWSQLLTDVFDWTRHSGSTPTMMTGPSSDHTTGGGHYLYIEANSASYGDTSRLISSECSDSGPQCLQFWYHMYGSADTMGLHVYLLQNNLANAVWRKRNDQGNMWHLAQVDITTTGAFQIIFEGRIGSNDQSDVAIDDVSLHRGHCTDVAKPTKPAPSTFNPVVTEGPERPPANSPTAAQPQTATSSKPQRPSTTTATTTTTPTTTAATTNCDTQTPSRPATTTTPKTSNPNVPTTKPQLPITSTTTTTSGPHPPATEHPGAETSEQPEPEITARPQTTAAPEQPAISTNEPQTTAGPHPTTQYPGLETSEQPEPEITHGPQTTTEPEQPDTLSTDEPQTPAGPHPTTEHPGLETSEQPEPEITDGPQTTAEPEQPDTSSTDEPKTPAGPHPTTAHPGLETSEQPEPEITENPQMTTRPGQPATPNEPQTSGGPQPQTTESQEPTAGSQPPTTARPQPPTTARPQPPTTARPQPPTETQPQTTIKPQPPTTARPQPPTTARPQPPTTARPQPPTARPQPPTTPIPTPSCPANSHYTTCIPTCSPTCTYLNGPPRCSDDDGCVPGCVCDDGFVRRGRVCVPIQQCGCVDRNGTKHHFNEVWYTDHCRQKCECEKDDGVGEIDCDDDDECDGNAVCLQNEEGDYYCQSTGFGECIITRDPEYRTFDKMKHDFEGEHSYVLVRTNNLPNNLLHVYIEGINTAHDDDDSHHHDDSSSEEDHSRRVRDEDEDDDDDDDDDKQDDDSDENEEHHRLQELKIRVYDHTVEFKKHRRLMVSIRGIFNTTLPPSHFPLAPFQQTHYFVHGIISSYFLPTHRHL